MTPLMKLERFLIDNGLAVDRLSQKQTWAVASDWGVVFGSAWGAKCRMRTGHRALHEYAQQSAQIFHIVPLAPQRGGPPEVTGGSQLRQGFECRGDGPLPDLSDFADLEFAVSPPGLDWTLAHTHEDHALGGPCFIRREWAEAGHRPDTRR